MSCFAVNRQAKKLFTGCSKPYAYDCSGTGGRLLPVSDCEVLQVMKRVLGLGPAGSASSETSQP